MDGFSGYNQVKVFPEDQEKTTFTTPWGTFMYAKMSFRLMNAGAISNVPWILVLQKRKNGLWWYTWATLPYTLGGPKIMSGTWKYFSLNVGSMASR